MFRKNQIPDIIDIALWGPPQSGKTNYLVLLQLVDREGWAIRPGNMEAMEFLNGGTELLESQRIFIPATLPTQGETFLPFEFEKKGLLKPKIFRVFLPECAGEYYENPRRGSEFVKRICRSHGILWLVDPLQINNPQDGHKGYPEMIYEWLSTIYFEQGGGRINKHMAFCLTKMDHPNHVSHFDDPRKYCLKLLGRKVQVALEDFCYADKVDFYSTSAAGFIPGTTKSCVDPNDPQKLTHPPNPKGLFDPLSWLFSEI